MATPITRLWSGGHLNVILTRSSGSRHKPVEWRRVFSRWSVNRQQQTDLFPQRLSVPENHGYVPTLSPPQVTSLLTANEASIIPRDAKKHIVKWFDSNQLASNQPIEDRRAVARLLQNDGSLFAVYDGHGGAACAQSISERLLDYVAVSLLSLDKLERYNHAMRTDAPMDLLERVIFNNDYLSEGMSPLFRTSLQKFVVQTLSTLDLEDEDYIDNDPVASALKTAFIRLDNDISEEAQPSSGVINFDSLNIGLSGACACVAHLTGQDLRVANLGDTRAVVGRLKDDGKWTAVPLTTDHNAENENEAKRVKSAHPISEADFVLKASRLLGYLTPLRAFGDIRFKWSVKDLKAISNILEGSFSQNILLKNYYTPPYLTNEPQIQNHKLTKEDQFMILASDGLWEMLPNDEVVSLVGEHLEGRQTTDRFRPKDVPVRTLANINTELVKRKTGLAHKAVDVNCATHLIRHALGFEHRKVSEMLTFPPYISRHYRDDITVIVVYFNTDIMV